MHYLYAAGLFALLLLATVFTSSPNFGAACKGDPNKSTREKIETCAYTSDEKASIKGQELAKVGPKQKIQKGEYEIEILSTTAIEGGVQVTARAWDSKGQIGFGDGTIDIERFNFYNPPLLVPDPAGDIERTHTNPETGVSTIKRYTEDPEEALLQLLAKVISVKKEKHSAAKIIRGKVGNTTSTFQPAAGANSPVDGYIGREDEATWSDSRDAADGDHKNVVQAFFFLNARLAGGQYTIRRVQVYFNTAAIPDTDVISATTLTVVRDDTVGFSNAESVSWCVQQVSSPGADNGISDSDYNNQTSAEAGTRVTLASTATDTATVMTFNANGIGFVSKTGLTYLGMRLSNDIDNSAPSGSNIIGFYSADATGTTNDPLLTVEHAVAANPITDDDAWVLQL